MTVRPRHFWGWGREGQGPSPEQQQGIAQVLGARFGLDDVTITPPPRIEEIALRAPRVSAPRALAELFSADPTDRAGHTYGKAFRDVVRALAREYPHPPDLVAFPRNEADVTAILDWCTGERLAAREGDEIGWVRVLAPERAHDVAEGLPVGVAGAVGGIRGEQLGDRARRRGPRRPQAELVDAGRRRDRHVVEPEARAERLRDRLLLLR